MNKAVLTEELNNVGIITTCFEFSQAGYVLELKLDPERATGWEELELLPITGVELVKVRTMGEYNRKVLFIPSSNTEFKDYVIKHIKCFGLGRQKALSDLKETIMKFGKKQTQSILIEYLKKVGYR